MARKGKIARLPFELREELNKRLRNGEKAATLLPWLNGLPEVKAVLQEDFEGLLINDENLSAWRKGGYQEWLDSSDKRFQRLERIRELSQMSMKLAAANGGNLSEGAASIVGGSILEVLELIEDLKSQADASLAVAPAEGDGGDPRANRIKLLSAAIDDLTIAIARMRRGDHDKQQLDLNRERLNQGAEVIALARQKFQRDTCNLFLKWHEDRRALDVVNGAGDNTAKIEQLGALMFGEDWRPANASGV